MRARVAVPHDGIRRGSVIDVDGRAVRTRRLLAGGWLVPLDPPSPPEKPPPTPKRRKRVEPPANPS
jgi:hypothetical protein